MVTFVASAAFLSVDAMLLLERTGDGGDLTISQAGKRLGGMGGVLGQALPLRQNIYHLSGKLRDLLLYRCDGGITPSKLYAQFGHGQVPLDQLSLEIDDIRFQRGDTLLIKLLLM